MPASSSTASTRLAIQHDHVAIRAKDYAATTQWYVEKLDFAIDQEWLFGDMQLAYLSNGSAKVEILGGSDAQPPQRASDLEHSFGNEGYHHFCLAVDDLDATIEELARRGVPVVGEPFVVTGSIEDSPSSTTTVATSSNSLRGSDRRLRSTRN